MTSEEFLREQSFAQKILFVGGPWDGKTIARPMGSVLFKFDAPCKPNITSRMVYEGEFDPGEVIEYTKFTYELVKLKDPVRWVYYFEGLLKQLRKHGGSHRYPDSERENDVR